MEDPTAETAKAVQEVAKTGREALNATQRLGAFAAKLVHEPVDSVVGILADRLRYVRWERQLRLLDRAKEMIKERKLEGKLTPIPPKLALPIIEGHVLSSGVRRRCA